MALRNRENGVLMHVSSLPGPYGIGTFGQEARMFAHKLSDADVTYWQVLPFTVVGNGNSPYSSISAFAGNPFFIDPGLLVKDGFLTEQERRTFEYHQGSPWTVDYDFVRINNEHYLRLAYSRAKPDVMATVLRFAGDNRWLHDFGAYVVIKNYYKGLPWWKWPDEGLKFHRTEALNAFLEEHEVELHYIYFVQWLFYKQWTALKDYCNELGVGIIGDMPIFVAHDSCDVWSNTRYFQLDEDLDPTEVAGVPPDYFSEDGQLWGNPLYDWDRLEQDDYRWWVDRIRHSLVLYNRVRIDHFRGFESYWAVPAGSKTARVGRWRKGPAMKLFDTVTRHLGNANIIAEDLGDINDDVREFLKKSGFPGMKVLQFAFNPYFDDCDLPHRYIENMCAYTGTHDNQTTFGWICEASEEERRYALEYSGFPPTGDWLRGGSDAPAVQAMIRALWSSVAFFAAAPIQDFLGFGGDTRMNTPGVAEGNWRFRVGPGCLENWNITFLKRMNLLYGRNNPYKDNLETSLLTEAELEVERRQRAREQSPEIVMAQLSKLPDPVLAAGGTSTNEHHPEEASGEAKS